MRVCVTSRSMSRSFSPGNLILTTMKLQLLEDGSTSLKPRNTSSVPTSCLYRMSYSGRLRPAPSAGSSSSSSVGRAAASQMSLPAPPLPASLVSPPPAGASRLVGAVTIAVFDFAAALPAVRSSLSSAAFSAVSIILCKPRMSAMVAGARVRDDNACDYNYPRHDARRRISRARERTRHATQPPTTAHPMIISHTPTSCAS
mmetsp:Transcript_7136/g.25431  ORF Transcript_7136/g.25431 Transcript_7136/m.25431 type:complete len:201 (-) Transcript_7136:44-646(-)